MATSKIFGEVEALTNAEMDQLDVMMKRGPHIIFGALNRRLNERGLCLFISELTERDKHENSLPGSGNNGS